MKTNKEPLRTAMDRRLSFLDDLPSCRAAVQHRIAQEEEPVIQLTNGVLKVFCLRFRGGCAGRSKTYQRPEGRRQGDYPGCIWNENHRCCDRSDTTDDGRDCFCDDYIVAWNSVAHHRTTDDKHFIFFWMDITTTVFI